ncbi:precorrin-6Y C5,15-methyltransferase (decarboxylating) subunit CbiT [Acidianus sulfidivorans JP7]|uniref:Probable cobalt-precorrin-6B C(15)-methyltransferase (decarboxylating) n=1 Tax=Acidianus sulfidivorans JP7 TaxID=619593 RepID=A0A2U9IJW0_9CREN|nr:precorrin-6Y C5,15-methyltransferase (decarboxylating) subunit CbiT [Acidianus sulfidivorans]AWR96329.1 precorrin-6Y C5,15-methyltransferase (decarboxylating) subunit CbiT [Acidianus sulfidivorans JP7]
MGWNYITPGIPDEEFIRDEKVPMTKEEIRSILISKLRLNKGYKAIDIGSGTGSVTVELGLMVGENGTVYSIERDEKAFEITRKNIEKFGLKNVTLIKGEAPEALHEIKEKVNSVFIGGSENLEENIEEVKERLLLPKGRIVIDAILLETVSKAISMLEGFKVEVTEAIIAKGMKTSKGYAMISRNPIFIISAEKV